MAYEFSPDADIEDPVSDGQNGQVIEFALGFDTEDDLVVLMAVMLTATDRQDSLELHFGIRMRIANGAASAPDYSKEAVDKYVPKHGRRSIANLVRQSVEKVILKANPECITMETFYPHLPQKALQKYDPVCGAIIGCGYRIADEWRNENNGKNYWIFRQAA